MKNVEEEAQDLKETDHAANFGQDLKELVRVSSIDVNFWNEFDHVLELRVARVISHFCPRGSHINNVVRLCLRHKQAQEDAVRILVPAYLKCIHYVSLRNHVSVGRNHMESCISCCCYLTLNALSPKPGFVCERSRYNKAINSRNQLSTHVLVEKKLISNITEVELIKLELAITNATVLKRHSFIDKSAVKASDIIICNELFALCSILLEIVEEQG